MGDFKPAAIKLEAWVCQKTCVTGISCGDRRHRLVMLSRVSWLVEFDRHSRRFRSLKLDTLIKMFFILQFSL